jgi:hypothetical protein
MMLSGFESFIVIAAPLLAGLILIATVSFIICRNPTISNAHAGIVVAGALLCVAPTLTTLNLKAPGIEIVAAVKQQAAEQSARVAVQCAQVKRDLTDLQKQLNEVSRKTGVATPATAQSESEQQVRRTVILIFYSATRETLAKNMEQYLLDKGYAANSIKTDFSELSEESRLPAGSISIVYTNTELADAVKQALRPKFPEMNRISDSLASKLSAADVQIRLF